MNTVLKIAICDDDGHYRKYIRDLVQQFLEERKIAFHIDMFSSGEEFCRINENLVRYDIVLLDIGMKKLSGMDVAYKIRENSLRTQIVFITVMLEYAPEGYIVQAFRYIMKDKLSQLLPECLTEILKGYKNQIQMMEFPFKGGSKKIVLGELFYIESRLHRLEFNRKGDMLYLYQTLDELENQLLEYDFVRVHQSFLVNMDYIVTMQRYQLELSNGKQIPIAKKRYSFVKERFILYKEEI